MMLTLLFALSLASLAESKDYPPSYEGPVVGILTQRAWGKMSFYGHSYLAASYVKFAELSGAQVVPIVDTWDEEKLKEIFNSVNGIIFPGGGQSFPDSSYYKAGALLYKWALEANKNGQYFPIWGTCLGFEMLLVVEANLPVEQDLRFNCSSHMANNLTVLEGAQQSKMLEGIPSDLYLAMQTEPLVYNSHNFCIKPDWFTDPSKVLASKFNLLATNADAGGLMYAAMVEHKKYPIYGTQFHPEKNAFEWTIYEDIPHSRHAVSLMQYFSNFFIGEVMQNQNKFNNVELFYKLNINNYRPYYTLVTANSTLQSCYFFTGREAETEFSHANHVHF